MIVVDDPESLREQNFSLYPGLLKCNKGNLGQVRHISYYLHTALNT